MTREQGTPDPSKTVLRAVAMPADTNPAGDIFGGWVLSQMDLAGGVVAKRRARGRVVTVAVDAMRFHRPVHVGDVMHCNAWVTRIGRTSLAVQVEAWAQRALTEDVEKVTEGVFTYVAIDEDLQPRPVDG